jgi:D-beta-D-heptose 7-phosphate kinase/D-beta-D-heptose 1-phosphate adenosyltransferase
MNIKELGAAVKGIRAVVLGDMMLDSYQWGKVQRISPEAPVPVIEINREEFRLGGAANVALNLASLGAQVSAIGITGTGPNARIMRKLFKQHGLDPIGLIAEKGRKTTIKTRIGAANQQIVRIDIEDTRDISEQSLHAALEAIKNALETADLLIIEDYDKGLLRQELISASLLLCKERKIPVAVDPKQKHFFDFKHVDIFKPNYIELQANLGKRFENDEDFFAAARFLQNKIGCKHLVVTRGSRGMYIFSKKSPMQHLPSCAREVFDVSGAGDTVISALGLAYCAGADIRSAAGFANHAAGIVCGKMGTATTTIEEILDYAGA